MKVKERIAKYIADKRRFSIMINSYVFLDGFCYDTSDPDVLRFIAKFNTSAMTINAPTFGSPIANTGLQEIVVSYDQIVAVTLLDVSDDLMDKFKTDYPEMYEYLSKYNKVEGVNHPVLI